MTWDEVRQLHRQGFEIGSHTVDHPILSQVSSDQLHFELRESKRRIELETGAPCTAIAYPNGRPESVSQAVVNAAREEDYRLGFTVIEQFTARPLNALAWITAARHPRTTVVESGGNRGSGTHSRSAITGRYVTGATAQRHPNTTTTEKG